LITETFEAEGAAGNRWIDHERECRVVEARRVRGCDPADPLPDLLATDR